MCLKLGSLESATMAHTWVQKTAEPDCLGPMMSIDEEIKVTLILMIEVLRLPATWNKSHTAACTISPICWCVGVRENVRC